MSQGRRPFTDEEINKIKIALKGTKNQQRNNILIEIGINTGFRIGEILSLKVKDVYTSSGDIHDKIAVQKQYMKNKTGSREVVISDRLRKELANYWKYIKEIARTWKDYYLFHSFRGDPAKKISYRNIEKMIKQVCEKAQIKIEQVGTHSLRKTYCSEMYSQLGNNIRQLQGAMGHSSIAVTEKYLPQKWEVINDANKKLDMSKKKKKVIEEETEEESLSEEEFDPREIS